jgi:carboxymethylenebutenolidase
MMTEFDGLRGYFAEATDAHTAVLVLPSVHGLSADTTGFADALAEAGISALAWDPWHGPTADDTSSKKLFGMMSKLADTAVITEQRNWLDFLQGKGYQRIGTMGFCLGGRLTFLLAGADRRVASVVAYHPTIPAKPAPNHTVDVFDSAARTPSPVLVHYPQECYKRLTSKFVLGAVRRCKTALAA